MKWNYLVDLYVIQLSWILGKITSSKIKIDTSQPIAKGPPGSICWIQTTSSFGTQVCYKDSNNIGLHSSRGLHARHYRSHCGVIPLRGKIQGISSLGIRKKTSDYNYVYLLELHVKTYLARSKIKAWGWAFQGHFSIFHLFEKNFNAFWGHF